MSIQIMSEQKKTKEKGTKKCSQWDLNPQPSAYKTETLPIEIIGTALSTCGEFLL